jgi:truncated hemoglobin YjbI
MTLRYLGGLALVAGLAVGCGDDGTTGGGGSAGAPSTGGSAGAPSTGGAGGDGGGAGVECDVCADYGAAVPDVVSNIVDQAAADPMFEADFAPLVAMGPAAVDAFKASLTAFISDAYGCTTNTYTGPTMEEAHTGLGITQAEYDAFVGLCAGVLADAGVPGDYITECFAPGLTDQALVDSIVGQ